MKVITVKYRVIHNSLSHFIKSAHFNGAKDGGMAPPADTVLNKSTWRVSLSIYVSHVEVLFAVQVY
jgi:hypothetical protein